MPCRAAYADTYLAGLPGRDELLVRVTELTASGVTLGGFAVAGARVFCLRQDPGTAVPVLAVHEAGGERVLLDPAGMAGSEHSHLDWYVPSLEGRHVACGISQGGSENSTLRIIDVATGGLSAEAMPRTPHGAVSWLPDGSGFVYHRFSDPAPDTPPSQWRQDSGTFLHRLGRPVEDDVLVLARGHNPLVPMSPRDRPFVLLPGGSDWMIAVIAHGVFDLPLDRELNDCTLYAAPRTWLADPASCPWRQVAGAADGVTAFAADGDTMYVVSHRDSRRSELLVLDVDGGISRLREVPLAGGQPREVPLPVRGTIGEWTGSPDRASALFMLQSWTHSPRLYRYDGSTGTVGDTGWIPSSPVDLSDDVEVTDLRVPARDGTLIPLCVLHRKGLVPDGSGPALLTGYGSHGWVQPRAFSPQLLPWYERGGIYAVAGPRGGGDYGRPWHEAGRARTRNARSPISSTVPSISSRPVTPGPDGWPGWAAAPAPSRPQARWYAGPTCGPRWCYRYRSRT
jgi:prolyl oligopeptidase